MTSDEFEAALYLMGFTRFATHRHPEELRLRSEDLRVETKCDDGNWAVTTIYEPDWGEYLPPAEAYLKLRALCYGP